MAFVEDERAKRRGARLFVRGPGGAAVMVGAANGNAEFADLGRHVDRDAVDDAVHAAVQNNAAHVGQALQKVRRHVVGIDFAVNAERADLARQTRVFVAAKIENDDAVLRHGLPPYNEFPMHNLAANARFFRVPTRQFQFDYTHFIRVRKEGGEGTRPAPQRKTRRQTDDAFAKEAQNRTRPYAAASAQVAAT